MHLWRIVLQCFALPLDTSSAQVRKSLRLTLKQKQKLLQITRNYRDKKGRRRVSGGKDLRLSQRYPVGLAPG